jgi:hypothetical protein
MLGRFKPALPWLTFGIAPSVLSGVCVFTFGMVSDYAEKWVINLRKFYEPETNTMANQFSLVYK